MAKIASYRPPAFKCPRRKGYVYHCVGHTAAVPKIVRSGKLKAFKPGKAPIPSYDYEVDGRRKRTPIWYDAGYVRTSKRRLTEPRLYFTYGTVRHPFRGPGKRKIRGEWDRTCPWIRARTQDIPGLRCGVVSEFDECYTTRSVPIRKLEICTRRGWKKLDMFRKGTKVDEAGLKGLL